MRKLVHPALVPAALEGRLKEGIDDLARQLGPQETGTQRQQIRIIVSAGETGRRHVMAQRRPHQGVTIRRDRDPDARAADDDAPARRAVRDRLCGAVAVVGIIDRFLAMGAEIENPKAPRFQMRGDQALHRETGMIAGHDQRFGGSCRRGHGAVFRQEMACRMDSAPAGRSLPHVVDGRQSPPIARVCAGRTGLYANPSQAKPPSSEDYETISHEKNRALLRLSGCYDKATIMRFRGKVLIHG